MKVAEAPTKSWMVTVVGTREVYAEIEVEAATKDAAKAAALEKVEHEGHVYWEDDGGDPDGISVEEVCEVEPDDEDEA